MLTIRLQRVGKKKYPSYRLIVSEKARDTKGTFLENLGTYDPHLPAEKSFNFNVERINYWLSKGSQTSDTVHNVFVSAKILKGDKKKTVFLSKKRSAKIAEKKKAAAPAPAPAAAPAA